MVKTRRWSAILGAVYLEDPARPLLRHSRLAPTPALSGPGLSALTRAERRSGQRTVTTGLTLPVGYPDDLRARSLAVASLYPAATLCGWSAVAIHGGSVPPDASPEICVGPSMRRRAGVLIRRHSIPCEEIMSRVGAQVTTPLWTAFDLARFLPFEKAVIAVESAHGRLIRLEDMPDFMLTVSGRWGAARARRVIAAADARAESPMETLLRLTLYEAGFTDLVPQVKVPELRCRIDLGDRHKKIAVEYDGEGHFDDPDRIRREKMRRNRLTAAGWIVIEVEKYQFYREREALIRMVADAYRTAR